MYINVCELICGYKYICVREEFCGIVWVVSFGDEIVEVVIIGMRFWRVDFRYLI